MISLGLLIFSLNMKHRAPIVPLQNLYPAYIKNNKTKSISTWRERCCMKSQILRGEFTACLNSSLRLTSKQQRMTFLTFLSDYNIPSFYVLQVLLTNHRKSCWNWEDLTLNLQPLWIVSFFWLFLKWLQFCLPKKIEGKTNNIVYLEPVFNLPTKETMKSWVGLD